MVVSPAYGEADYIADNYGQCALATCACLQPHHPWLGRGCPHWRPVAARSMNEMRESLRRG